MSRRTTWTIDDDIAYFERKLDLCRKWGASKRGVFTKLLLDRVNRLKRAKYVTRKEGMDCE